MFKKIKLYNVLKLKETSKIQNHLDILSKIEMYAKENNAILKNKVLMIFHTIDILSKMIELEILISTDRKIPPNEKYEFIGDVELIKKPIEYYGNYDTLFKYYEKNSKKIKLPLYVLLNHTQKGLDIFILNHPEPILNKF